MTDEGRRIGARVEQGQASRCTKVESWSELAGRLEDHDFGIWSQVVGRQQRRVFVGLGAGERVAQAPCGVC